MSVYTRRIEQIKNDYLQQQNFIDKLQSIIKEYNMSVRDFNDLVDANRILVTVTDLNTRKVVSFIENIINKALLEMYPSGEYYIKVVKNTNRRNPNIEVCLYDSDNIKDTALDLGDQAGDGVSRIISFLFSLSLIELCGGRKFISLDEVLTGFHSDSLQIIKNIITIFKDGGFQFIISEYDINDMGVIYVGKKVGSSIKMEELGYADTVKYERKLI